MTEPGEIVAVCGAMVVAVVIVLGRGIDVLEKRVEALEEKEREREWKKEMEQREQQREAARRRVPYRSMDRGVQAYRDAGGWGGSQKGPP